MNETRRRVLSLLAPAVVSLPLSAEEERERRALLRIVRLAEEWGGHVLNRRGRAVPPKGSIYRMFWDLAQDGLQ